MSRARDVADGALGTIAGTNGQVLTSDGNNWSSQAVPTELPAHGTSGNVLTSTGSAWASQAAAGGGAWDLLSTATVTSNVAQVDFNGSSAGFDSTKYQSYCIIFPYWGHSNSLGSSQFAWLYTSGGSQIRAPRHKFSMAQFYNSYAQATDNSGNYIKLSAGDGPHLSGQIFFTLDNPPYTSGSTTLPTGSGGPRMTSHVAHDEDFFGLHANRTLISHTAGNMYETGLTMTGVRLYGEYNNISKAKFYLYGIKL